MARSQRFLVKPLLLAARERRMLGTGPEGTPARTVAQLGTEAETTAARAAALLDVEAEPGTIPAFATRSDTRHHHGRFLETGPAATFPVASSGRRAPGRGLRPKRGSPPPGRSLGQAPSGNPLPSRLGATRRDRNVVCRSPAAPRRRAPAGSTNFNMRRQASAVPDCYDRA